MNRRHFLSCSIATLLVLASSPGVWAQGDALKPLDPALREKIAKAVQKGLAYLEKSQKADGYWSSPDYPGLTGLVVQAFATAEGGKHRGSKSVKEGLKFIRSHAKPDGGIYNRGMGNYNTAVALSTLVLAGDAEDQARIEAARKYLIGAQAKNSANPSHDGGFGYEAGGSGRMSRPDLDNTVFALEALSLAREAQKSVERPGQADLNWQAAVDFITRCQNLPSVNKEKTVSTEADDKGGFIYTPGGGENGNRSYGTMSYAGVLSLVYAQVKKDDERVKAAVDWLARHFTVEENPGRGQEGLYYYYLVMAKGLKAAGMETLEKQDGTKVEWRGQLAAKLISLQKPDGSWANENGRWMEKDPALVTSYVVLALNILSQGAK